MTEALPDDDAKKGKKKKKVTLSSVWRWYLTSIDLSQLRSIDLNGHSLFSHWGHSPKKAILHSGLPLLSYSIIHYNFFLLFLYLFCLSLFISVFICYHYVLSFLLSIIYISFRFQNIFHIFPNMYFPISTNIFSNFSKD